MDWDTWSKLYKRLLSAYNKTANGEQASAYFEALGTFSSSLVEQAVSMTIAEHKTWPSVAELCERARGIIKSTPYAPSGCDVCHGNLWVDTDNQTHFNIEYRDYVRRCPQCYRSAA